jgi:hypothetical protein
MARFAELADGRRLEFPDGTPDSVINSAVQRELSVERSPQPISQFNDPRGAALTLGSGLVAQPVSGIAGLIGLAGGLVPGGESPSEKGARFVREAQDFLTIDPPNEASERALTKIGETVESASNIASRVPAALGSLPSDFDES